MTKQMRGLRLLEFASSNDLVLMNTLHHTASRRWTWNSPNGQHHNQIDHILVRKHFWSGVSSARTQNFPGADIGSGHVLLMMTFHLHEKRISKPKHTTQVWPRKAERPQCVGCLQSYDRWEVAPLTIMNNEDTDMDSRSPPSTQQWLWCPNNPHSLGRDEEEEERLYKHLIVYKHGIVIFSPSLYQIPRLIIHTHTCMHTHSCKCTYNALLFNRLTEKLLSLYIKIPSLIIYKHTCMHTHTCKCTYNAFLFNRLTEKLLSLNTTHECC